MVKNKRNLKENHEHTEKRILRSVQTLSCLICKNKKQQILDRTAEIPLHWIAVPWFGWYFGL